MSGPGEAGSRPSSAADVLTIETAAAPPRGGCRVERLHWAGAALRVRDVLRLWRDAPGFAHAFSAHLAAHPAPALRWETPGLVAGDLDRLYEHALIDAPALAGRAPDQAAFASALAALGPAEAAARFSNLGGDAVLVAPAALSDPSDCTDLAAFCRAAPPARAAGFWRAVAEAVLARVSERPVWLSTAGGGVAWLHVRLDDRPKYYAHAPYRDGAR